MSKLQPYMNDIRQICSRHGVRRLYAFGSVLTENFDRDSDIDLLVEFEPMEPTTYTENYFDLKYSLQRLLGRPIDLLEDIAVKNPYFRSAIDAQKNLVYGHLGEVMAVRHP